LQGHSVILVIKSVIHSLPETLHIAGDPENVIIIVVDAQPACHLLRPSDFGLPIAAAPITRPSHLRCWTAKLFEYSLVDGH
jgi:hypothetical protein